MPTVKYIAWDGEEFVVEAPEGHSVMDAAIAKGVPGIAADCGGACTCATCHVLVDDAWLGKLAPPEEMEEAMIEFAMDPQANSRLSCQLKLTADLDGLVVRLPKSQF